MRLYDFHTIESRRQAWISHNELKLRAARARARDGGVRKISREPKGTTRSWIACVTAMNGPSACVMCVCLCLHCICSFVRYTPVPRLSIVCTHERNMLFCWMRNARQAGANTHTQYRRAKVWMHLDQWHWWECQNIINIKTNSTHSCDVRHHEYEWIAKEVRGIYIYIYMCGVCVWLVSSKQNAACSRRLQSADDGTNIQIDG